MPDLNYEPLERQLITQQKGFCTFSVGEGDDMDNIVRPWTNMRLLVTEL